MSSWAKNVSFNDTIVSQMTSAPTTAAPTTPAATTAPATTAAPSYVNNPGFGGGGVVFPLPVAPSLLDGDITALNPIPAAPTTTAAPETLAPIPEVAMPMEEDVEEEPSWSWKKVVFLLFIALVVLGAVYYFFIRNRKSNASGNGANRGRASNNSNNLNNGNNLNNNGNNANNGNNLNYNNSALNDFNNSNSFANTPANLKK